MKRTATALLFFICITALAQNTYVPNDEFEQQLIDLGYDSGSPDNYVPTANISGVTELHMQHYVSDYEGIQDFAALSIFYCYGSITSIDLSQNVNLTKLTFYTPMMATVDLTNNTALEELEFIGDTSVEDFDLSQNTALKKLSIQYAGMLDHLDLSHNTLLEDMEVNAPLLSSFDLSHNTLLTHLLISAESLPHLDLSQNAALVNLTLNNMNLNNIALSHNTALVIADIEYCNIANLDFTHNLALTDLYLFSNTTLSTINVSANTALERLSVLGCSNVTQLDLTHNGALKTLSLGTIQVASIDLSQNSALKDLYVFTLPMTNIDLSQNSNLNYANISYTPIVDLNLSNNLSVSAIELDSVALTSLDFSETPALDYLSVKNCSQLGSIQISNNAFRRLFVYNCPIATIDLSQLHGLESVEFSNTQLTSLDLSHSEALVGIRIKDNSLLSSLDLRNGNNSGFLVLNNYLELENNPNLTCVLVDDAHSEIMNNRFWHEIVDNFAVMYANNESECAGPSGCWQSFQTEASTTTFLDTEGKLFERANYPNIVSIKSLAGNAVWRSISVGPNRLFPIKDDGTLWGKGYLIGNGVTNTNELTQLGADTDWNKVSSSNDFSLALKNNGSLWGWGFGLMGSPINYDRMQIGTDSDWKEISTGFRNSAAIKTDGTLWMWGMNNYGQLGIGNADWITSPTQVGSDTDWKMVEAGDRITLGIKNNGTLWVWGGQVGGSYTPVQIGTDSDWQSVSLSNYNLDDLQTGRNHYLALKNNGTLWSWGYYNCSGSTGFPNPVTMLPTQIGSDSDWVKIVASFVNDFALKADGSLYDYKWRERCSFELVSCILLDSEEHQSATFEIFPNPVKDILTIQSSKPIDKINVTDLLGKLVLELPYAEQIDLSALQKGMYILRIFSGNEIDTSKIIKE